MARRNRTPEENARREKIRELLQMANIGSMDTEQNNQLDKFYNQLVWRYQK